MLNAEVSLELVFEPFDLGTMDETLAIANPDDGVEQLLAERIVLRL
jgi:hypothetical protein